MLNDLFSDGQEFEKLPLEDAEVFYRPRIDLGTSLDLLLRRLIDEVPWRAENITVWGKTFAQPRLVAWYGDDGKDYSYSGLSLNALPWTDLLLNLKRRVEAATKATFNSVLLNYYRDQRDSMGFHSDDEAELGDRPIIASLTLGQERTFIFKHKKKKTLKSVRLKLGSGSLLLMKGETQQNWKHGIDKETAPCGPRVNLTFRRIYR